ncbi:MAG: hypothetical protein WBF39_05740 [Planococcus donghaensis]
MKQISEQQLLEIFGGIGAPRKSFTRMNIPHKQMSDFRQPEYMISLEIAL